MRIRFGSDPAFRGAILAALAACLLIAARADLWQPYEPDLTETAREMYDRGDWVIPVLNGIPYYEKPPLFYWLAMVSAHAAGGFTEFTARWPSLAAGAAALLATAFLARGLFGRRSAFAAAALFATTPVFLFSFTKGMTDGLLGATTLVSACLFQSVLWGREGGRRDAGAPARRAAVPLAWIALALAFLAKGPVAVAFVALMLLPEMLLTGKLRPRAVRWKSLALGIALFLAIASAWYVLGAIRNGREFLHGSLVEQNLGRFFDSAGRGGPLYYVFNLPGQMGLWTLLLPAGAWIALRSMKDRKREAFNPYRFLLFGVLLQLAFLSASSAKISKYLLVCMPYLCLLAGEALLKAEAGAPRLVRRLAAGGLLLAGVLLIGAAVAVPIAVPSRLGIAPAWMLPLSAFLAAGGAGCLLGIRRSLPGAAAAACLSLAAAVLWISATPCLARLNDLKSDRPFAERAALLLAPDEPLLGFGICHFESPFLFYARRGYEWTASIDEILARCEAGERFYVLTKPLFFDCLPPEERKRFHIVDREGPQENDLILVEFP